MSSNISVNGAINAPIKANIISLKFSITETFPRPHPAGTLTLRYECEQVQVYDYKRCNVINYLTTSMFFRMCAITSIVQPKNLAEQ